MSKSITLTSGGTIVVLPGPAGAGTSVRDPVQYVRGSTVDGTAYSYRTTANAKRIWTIPLADLSNANKVDLSAFFYVVVGGPSNAWTYQHTDGETYAARFVNTSLDWGRQNGRQWSVTLVLEVTTEVL